MAILNLPAVVMAGRRTFPYDTGLVYAGLAMKVVSLVVEGLEQAQKAGLFDWLHEEDADVVCLQDTRCSEYTLKGDVYVPENYSPYFLDDFENPKRNGVAIYCKKLPKAIMTGLGFADFDSRGLYIQADYPNISVGSLLVPSGQAGDEAMNTKLKFLEQLGQHLQKVKNKRRDFIICGGWELIGQSIDAEEAGNRTDIPGFSSVEQAWLQELYQNGYCDAFRCTNASSEEFTWWPEGDDAGALRSDTQITSLSLEGRVDSAVINTDDAFSSHAPVIIEYDVDL
jgi:exodeoxyribonuclease-3